MYAAQIIQLATRYASPGRLIGRKAKVYGQRVKVSTGMQTRRLFG
jgi:hypothetical protein